MKRLGIITAANQHLSINFEEYDSPEWGRAVSILEGEFGFQREGKEICGMDEGILESFVKDETKILAGWDNWSGNYLLSESEKGDIILNLLIQKL